MLDVDDLFPERDPRDEPSAAVAAVCDRLGRPAHQPDADDPHLRNSVVAGAIDGDRTAWVELRSKEDDSGDEDIDGYTLYMAIGDEVIRTWSVDTYNPWFGCTFDHLQWLGDEVLAVYSEKHHTIACMLGVAGPRLRVIGHRWQRVGEHLLYASEARGLVERTRLPDLSRSTPLSLAGAAVALAGGQSFVPALPREPASLQRQIVARLPAIDLATAELLVGALAYRFWDDHPPVSARYEEAYALEHRWNTPCWLPYYWYCANEGKVARALLAALDAVAARTPVVCSPDELAAELAARHIATRCQELAAACRAGRLPEDAWCYFWVEWSQAAFAGAQRLFPAGMWAAWTAMRAKGYAPDAGRGH